MRILLVNDDGVGAPGLTALCDALRAEGASVLFAAPAKEQSGASHAITLRVPISVKKLDPSDGCAGYSVDGSPVDCVKVALANLCPEPPDAVVSGMNFGANVGTNLVYSGTVAAALEAAMMGTSGIAVSLEPSQAPDFAGAAKVAAGLINRLLGGLLRKGEAVNINIPARAAAEIRGVRLVGHHRMHFEDSFHVENGEGELLMHLTGLGPSPTEDGFSDLAALQAGYVTLTPIRFDMTDEALLARLKREGPWSLEDE